MKYTVKAYLEKSMKGLMADLETDDWNEVEAFIWQYCQQGLNCKFVDNTSPTYNGGEAYADLFNESTVEVEELIVRYSFM
jgi:hypothetical protein